MGRSEPTTTAQQHYRTSALERSGEGPQLKRSSSKLKVRGSEAQVLLQRSSSLSPSFGRRLGRLGYVTASWLRLEESACVPNPHSPRRSRRGTRSSSRRQTQARGAKTFTPPHVRMLPPVCFEVIAERGRVQRTHWAIAGTKTRNGFSTDMAEIAGWSGWRKASRVAQSCERGMRPERLHTLAVTSLDRLLTRAPSLLAALRSADRHSNC